jgi:hypothetical protein
MCLCECICVVGIFLDSLITSIDSGFPAPISAVKLAVKNARFLGPDETALMRNIGEPQEFKKWCTKIL